MKANELMIGDYISVKLSGMLIKVAAVHHKKAAYHAVVNKLFWVRESLLEPIPLTLEILEKNGFEKSYSSILTADGYKKLPQYKYKNMTQVQDICRNLITISYSDLEGGVYDIQCGISSHIYDLKYVHQLQHALRLCGINKNIEL